MAVVLYSGIWTYCVRWQPNAYLGIENGKSGPLYPTVVASVRPGTPAEQSGLLRGDRIVTLNGQSLDTLDPFYNAIGNGKPGDVVTMSVVRPGAMTPLTLHAVLQAWPTPYSDLGGESLTESISTAVAAVEMWKV